MFWDKNYTPSQNIEVLLEKENVTVEEFLDEDDIIQECKSQKKPLLTYFTRPDVIRHLVKLIITEPSEDLPVAQRFRHANIACEILTLGLPSLDEKLLADMETLQLLYSYLRNEPPLNPLLASFFSKTFRTLFSKKTDQDWFLYQQMCLKLLEYLKLQNNFVDLICKHFTTPVIPDLILQMMRNVEGGQLRRSLYDWFNEERLIEKLITILANVEESEKHANISEFLCDLIQQGRTMRQTEQDNDSFEPVFEGSNPILKNIESGPTLEALFNVILQPNAQESTIVSGITVVLKIIKPIVIVDERNPDRLKFIQDREKEIHDELLTTVISVIEPHLKHFNELLRNPPKKPDIVISAAKLSPPFGMTRLQICRLFTVLLQTNNEEMAKAICETDFFETLLHLFKQYCWNNFLHSEVEKCFQTIFYTSLTNNNSNMSTQVSNGSQSKHSTLGDNIFDNICDNIFNTKQQQQQQQRQQPQQLATADTTNNLSTNTINANVEDEKNATAAALCETKTLPLEGDNCESDYLNNHSISNNENNTNKEQSAGDSSGEVDINLDNVSASENVEPKEIENVLGDNNEQDVTKVPGDMGPSKLQTHVIVNCKIVSKLIDCWQHNRAAEESEKRRRLGYMGHLIQIFKHIINCISETEHIGALIENNFQTDADRELWQSIIHSETGDLTKALKTQNQLLANCNAHEAFDYNISLEFLTDTDLSDAFNNLCAYTDPSDADVIFALDYNTQQDSHDDNDVPDEQELINNTLNLLQFGGAAGSNMDDDDDDDEDRTVAGGEGLSIYGKTSSLLPPFTVTNNPWEMNDDFNVLKTTTNSSNTATPWTSDFGTDNFADFDAHFSSFSSDLGGTFTSATHTSAGNAPITSAYSSATNNFNNGALNPNERTSNYMITSKSVEEYDNNANVEKSAWPVEFTAFPLKKDSTPFVGRNFVDDYENDEGMWTRPLGVAVAAAAATTQQPSLHATQMQVTKGEEGLPPDSIKSNSTDAIVTTNGPSHLEATDDVDKAGAELGELGIDEQESNSDNELLNNSVEDNALINSVFDSIPIEAGDNNDEQDENEINLEVKPSLHKLNDLESECKLRNISPPIESVGSDSNAIDSTNTLTITTPTTTLT